MRKVAWISALAAAGCAEPGVVPVDEAPAEAAAVEGGWVAHAGRLSGYDVRGVRVSDDARWAAMGLDANTCQISLRSGSMGYDEDVVGGDDTVEDVGPGPDGEEVVLVGSADGQVARIRALFGREIDTTPVPGHLASRLTSDGFVSLADSPLGGCELVWRGDRASRVALEQSACGDGAALELDRATDTAWIPSPDGVTVATREGASLWDAGGDVVAFDALARALYVATAGAPEVRAYELDGTLRWAATMDGPVAGLADLGVLGTAVVSVQGEAGASDLVALDGFDGAVLDVAPMRVRGGPLATSADGARLVLVPGDTVDWFDIVGIDGIP